MAINIGDIVQYRAYRHRSRLNDDYVIKHAIVIDWNKDTRNFKVHLLEEGKQAILPASLIGKSWWISET